MPYLLDSSLELLMDVRDQELEELSSHSRVEIVREVHLDVVVHLTVLVSHSLDSPCRVKVIEYGTALVCLC